MGFYFGKSSKHNLKDVHPDLARLAEKALALSEVDFGISEGMRSIQQQQQNVLNGRSLTMNSYHLPQFDGMAHAIDVYGYVKGKASYTERHMKAIAKAFYQAAIATGIQIEWGGHWTDLVDMPHYQLNPDFYQQKEKAA